MSECSSLNRMLRASRRCRLGIESFLDLLDPSTRLRDAEDNIKKRLPPSSILAVCSAVCASLQIMSEGLGFEFASLGGHVFRQISEVKEQENQDPFNAAARRTLLPAGRQWLQVGEGG